MYYTCTELSIIAAIVGQRRKSQEAALKGCIDSIQTVMHRMFRAIGCTR